MFPVSGAEQLKASGAMLERPMISQRCAYSRLVKPAPLPYSAAKAALINLSKNLARQAGPHNVRVNCVAPGNILFPGGSWEKHLEARAEEVHRFIQTEVPLRRFGRPEEIADAIAFLCSDRSSFITGACIVADGGQTRSL